MKVVLGMEIGLSPGDFVLDGTQSPSPKGAGAPLPNFRPISIVVKRLDASKCHMVWMLASAQGTLCYMETQSFLPNKGGGAPSNSRPISIVPKRLDASRCHSVWR